MPETVPGSNNETTEAEVAPGEDLMDLDFTSIAEVSPAEIKDKEESAAKAAAAKAALESYDWDNPNQRRAGFN